MYKIPAFGCTLKFFAAITPQLYTFSLEKYPVQSFEIVVYFHDAMKFSEHKGKCELCIPNHL